MDDAIRHRAVGVGFVSSFFIHAVVMTSIMMIAGNTLHSTGKLLTVVLDTSGFSVAGGVGGDEKPVGMPTGDIRQKPCAPASARQTRNPKPAAESPLHKEPARPAIAPPAAPKRIATPEAAPVELPTAASTATDFIVGRAETRPIENAAVSDGPVTLSGKTGGSKSGSAVARGEAESGTGFGTATGLQGAGAGSGGGTGGPGGSGAGKGTAGLDLAKARYIKEQFHYIRELILRNINYPLIAKRMGWRGSVTVAFIIGEAGYVENIRIVRGSGHKILDENTVRAIERIQPFPKPPGRAEIVIPIEYQLG